MFPVSSASIQHIYQCNSNLFFLSNVLSCCSSCQFYHIIIIAGTVNSGLQPNIFHVGLWGAFFLRMRDVFSMWEAIFLFGSFFYHVGAFFLFMEVLFWAYLPPPPLCKDFCGRPCMYRIDESHLYYWLNLSSVASQYQY